VLLALPNIAGAAPPALEIEWHAPSGCPDRSTVRRYVEEMLGSGEAANSSLAARGGVLRLANDRWTADLAVRMPSGSESTRSFEGPTCESVTRAAALVIALSLHPIDPPALPPANPAERDTRSRPPIIGRFVRLAASGSGALDVGLTPGPAVGAAVTVGWSPVGSLRWEAGASYFATSRGTWSTDARLGADVSLAAFAVRGCYPVVDVALSVAPCLGGGFDSLRASGFGARSTNDASAVTTHAEAGGIILWNFNDFTAARLAVFGVIPVTRPEFVIDLAAGTATIYRPAFVVLRSTVGLELHF
jgi:hypothetical protein